jgi:hypothetical protein
MLKGLGFSVAKSKTALGAEKPQKVAESDNLADFKGFTFFLTTCPIWAGNSRNLLKTALRVLERALFTVASGNNGVKQRPKMSRVTARMKTYAQVGVMPHALRLRTGVLSFSGFGNSRNRAV